MHLLEKVLPSAHTIGWYNKLQTTGFLAPLLDETLGTRAVGRGLQLRVSTPAEEAIFGFKNVFPEQTMGEKALAETPVIILAIIPGAVPGKSKPRSPLPDEPSSPFVSASTKTGMTKSKAKPKTNFPKPFTKPPQTKNYKPARALPRAFGKALQKS